MAVKKCKKMAAEVQAAKVTFEGKNAYEGSNSALTMCCFCFMNSFLSFRR